jgi:hypothetical protein
MKITTLYILTEMFVEFLSILRKQIAHLFERHSFILSFVCKIHGVLLVFSFA